MEQYGRAGQATDDNIMWHMRFVCWITCCRPALRICDTYCLSASIMITRRRLNVTFIRTLPISLAYGHNICVSQFYTVN
jgi:hypothetical protein